MLRVGILYPRSGIYPMLASDFLSGIEKFLHHRDLSDKIELIKESIGFGSVEKEVYLKTENLIVEKKVDVVVAYIDLKMVPTLQPLLTASGKFFIVVNPGANYPDNWVAPRNTIFLTLLDSFLSRLTGRLAAGRDKKAIFAASIYDGGYLHSVAMVNAFIKSGGKMMFNYISPQKIKEFNIDSLAAYLETDKDTRTLLCIFSGSESNMFYKKLCDLPSANQLHLFVSPMMLEEQNLALPEINSASEIIGYIPWHTELNNEQNKLFKSNIAKDPAARPNFFSLLGWETGILIEVVSNHSIDFLKENTLESPRGTMHLDPLSHYLLAPAYLAKISNQQLNITEHINDIQQEWNAFTEQEQATTASGWLNTYLCY